MAALLTTMLCSGCGLMNKNENVQAGMDAIEALDYDTALVNFEAAKEAGKIDAFDLLLLDGNTDSPKVGWLDANGNPIVIDHKADMAEMEVQIDEKLATKVSAEEVDSKIESALSEIECAPITYEKVKYEIADTPVGTLVDYRDEEIRIMCPVDAEYYLQAVGTGGDANTYYVTLKTYCYDDNVVGYKETLNGQTDPEILTDLKVDNQRKYQPTWLGIAKYDETTDSWSYYGASSTTSKYIGWDYRIDWFDKDNVMIASDSIRINLSNENCHYTVEPYYIGKTKVEVEEMITKAVEDAAGIEVIEF